MLLRGLKEPGHVVRKAAVISSTVMPVAAPKLETGLE